MAVINKPEGLSKIWADLGEKRQPSDTKIQQGWVAEIPTYQDFNWLDGRQDQFIAHVNQHGFPVWDSTTEYRIFSHTKGSNGKIYESKTVNTNQNPTTDDGTNWVVAIDTGNRVLPAIDITPTNSWLVSGGGLFKAKVSGGCLVLNIRINSGTTTSSTIIGNLPTGYIPTYSQELPAMYRDGTNLKNTILILTNGDPAIRLGETITSNNELYCMASVIQ